MAFKQKSAQPLPALEQAILRRFQVTISRSDWQLDGLPPHLRMRFRLCDEQGKTIHCSRNFQELAEHCTRPVVAPSKGGAAADAPRLPSTTGMRTWEFAEPPQPIAVKDSSSRITALYHPALEIE